MCWLWFCVSLLIFLILFFLVFNRKDFWCYCCFKFFMCWLVNVMFEFFLCIFVKEFKLFMFIERKIFFVIEGLVNNVSLYSLVVILLCFILLLFLNKCCMLLGLNDWLVIGLLFFMYIFCFIMFLDCVMIFIILGILEIILRV